MIQNPTCSFPLDNADVNQRDNDLGSKANNTYRTWQIGFFCSTKAVLSLTVNPQVEGALTAVVGDCQ